MKLKIIIIDPATGEVVFDEVMESDFQVNNDLQTVRTLGSLGSGMVSRGFSLSLNGYQKNPNYEKDLDLAYGELVK